EWSCGFFFVRIGDEQEFGGVSISVHEVGVECPPGTHLEWLTDNYIPANLQEFPRARRIYRLSRSYNNREITGTVENVFVCLRVGAEEQQRTGAKPSFVDISVDGEITQVTRFVYNEEENVCDAIDFNIDEIPPSAYETLELCNDNVVSQIVEVDDTVSPIDDFDDTDEDTEDSEIIIEEEVRQVLLQTFVEINQYIDENGLMLNNIQHLIPFFEQMIEDMEEFDNVDLIVEDLEYIIMSIQETETIEDLELFREEYLAFRGEYI
ncbi:MAG: hypothetical protein ACMXYA_00900, partial [Candidatus Woesearchaeota archaeon]